jgi:hypothetical protein
LSFIGVDVAIQPIDLQVLFTQLDTVGKTQAAHKDTLVLQQAMQNIQIQKKTEADIQSVNESQDMGEGTEGVNDRGARKHTGGETSGQRQGKHDEREKPPELWDPLLGHNIDISG